MPTVNLKKIMNEAKTAALLISLIISFVVFCCIHIFKNLFQPSFIFFVDESPLPDFDGFVRCIVLSFIQILN